LIVSLRRKAIRSVKWTTVSTVTTVGIGLLQTIALSRLLLPRDFGLMAMVGVVQGFLVVFADMGISNAIILRQDATHEQLSSLYWLNLVVGAVMCGGVLLSTPLVVAFYHEPRVGPLMPWMALSFLIIPLGQQFQALAQRELQFDRLALIEISVALSTAAVAITCAWLGQGVFALIWGGLATVCVRSALLMQLGWKTWRPAFCLRFASLRGFLQFGFFQMGERAVLNFGSNVDYIMVGKFLGAGPLGVYRIAYELIVQPVYRLNPILTRVAWPVFAKKQDDNAVLRSAYLEMIRIIAFLLFPCLCGLAVVAPVFVPVVFGGKWNGAAPLIEILAAMALMRAMWNPSGSVLLAKGRADMGFYLNLLLAAVTTVSFWIAAPWGGTRAVAWCWVAIMYGYAVFSWKFIFKDTIGLEYREFLATIARPACMSAAMTAAVAVVSAAAIPVLGLTPVTLGVLVGTGAVTYGALLLALERPYLTGLWNMAFGRAAQGAA
jgi:O-antigen/teichoic acid export membrane protein